MNDGRNSTVHDDVDLVLASVFGALIVLRIYGLCAITWWHVALPALAVLAHNWVLDARQIWQKHKVDRIVKDCRESRRCGE